MKKIILSILTLATLGASAQNYEWATGIGGADDDYSNDIIVDASGNIYTTGQFKGTVDFDPGAGSTFLTSAGNFDIFVTKVDANGDFLWARSFGGTSYDSGQGITLDANGDVYITGGFKGGVNFSTGSSTVYLNSVTGYYSDIFLLKLNSAGDSQWAKSMGGSVYESGQVVKVDDSGNIYLAGRFEGTADFDPSASTLNLISKGMTDVFVSKFDNTGALLWAKSLGGNGGEYLKGLEVDASGNVYTTGSFQNTADFDPGAGTVNLTSLGGYDIFLSKLNSNGGFVWSKSIGGTGSVSTNDLVIDAQSNMYITGAYSGTVDFDTGLGILNQISNGNNDAFISKLNTNGDLVWVKSIGGANHDGGASISIDLAGNVYTTGSFRNTIDMDPGTGTVSHTAVGQRDLFILKLDNNGDYLWDNVIGTTGKESGKKIYLDDAGSIYVSGEYDANTDFDPGVGTTTILNSGNDDVFTMKYSQQTLITSIQINGQGGNFTVLQGATLQLTPSISPINASNQTVTWTTTNGTGSISVDANGLVTGVNIGTATVTATANDGSNVHGTYTIQVTSTIGINETIQNLDLNIFPNPTKGIVTFSATEQISSIEIYNLTGQKVATFNNTNTIDISNLSNGIYTAKVVAGKGGTTKKIIKE